MRPETSEDGPQANRRSTTDITPIRRARLTPNTGILPFSEKVGSSTPRLTEP